MKVVAETFYPSHSALSGPEVPALQLTSLDLCSANAAEEHRTVNTSRVLIVTERERESLRVSPGCWQQRSVWSDVLCTRAGQSL